MRRARIVVFAMFAVTVLAVLALAADAPPALLAKPPTIRAVAFSPNGQTLVAGFGAKDRPGGAAGWDVATGKRLWRLPGAAIPSVSFAPDGTAVAVARGTP